MKKFKIGILDVVIILFLILAVLFAVNYFKTSSETANTISDIIYKVELKSIPAENAHLYKVGDELTDSIKGGYLGKVINVDVSDNYEVREDTINDRFIKSSFSNKKDIILTIKGTPTVFDDRDIKFATVRVKIGEIVYIKTQNYASSGYIIDMEVVDNGGIKNDW